MQPHHPPGQLYFEYDLLRGGCLLQWAPMTREAIHPLCGRLLHAFLDPEERVTAIESFFFDHGGLPVNEFHERIPFLEGTYPLQGDVLRVGAFQFVQSPDAWTIWFSTGDPVPESTWRCERDSRTGIEVWFSDKKAKAGWPVPGIGGRAECPLLAGIRMDRSHISVQQPLTQVRILPGDFK